MGDAVTWTVAEDGAGARLDVAICTWTLARDDVPTLSRSRVKALIQNGAVELNGAPARPSTHVAAGDAIRLTVPDSEPSALVPENIPLNVLYEDDDLVAVNKPAGLVVHPGSGHATGTLVHALLHHCAGSLSGIGGATRPGIVHRLDKGTSGVIVVAKSDAAHRSLADQFAQRTVAKHYRALVYGDVTETAGVLTSPIGRHPTRRTKMAGGRTLAGTHRARTAETTWRSVTRWPGFAHLELTPRTGRTHQIRVHLADAGRPIIGDATYGGGVKRIPRKYTGTRISAALRGVKRPALHAFSLTVEHPRTRDAMTWTAPLPGDMAHLIDVFNAELPSDAGESRA